jgi:hypothetical protein
MQSTFMLLMPFRPAPLGTGRGALSIRVIVLARGYTRRQINHSRKEEAGNPYT